MAASVSGFPPLLLMHVFLSLFIYFGLHWVFLAAHRLALAAASRDQDSPGSHEVRVIIE